MSLVTTIKTLLEFKIICEEQGLDIIDELLKSSDKRVSTFKAALEFLERTKPKVLIETGTSRGRFDINLPSMCGDGGSTLIFAIWCSKNNSKVYTIDIDPVCIENCKLNIEALGLSEYVEFVVSDSVKYLDECEHKDIQFVFLDSYDFDYGNPQPSQIHHLKEYLAIKNKLHNTCCILIDDCDLPYGGKGCMVEPELLKDKFKLKISEYQHLYERTCISSIHTIGDSHSSNGWSGITPHCLGPLLCYSFGKEKLNRCDIRNFNIKDGDTIIFCLGEIDCRCHIHKHITETITYQDVINNMIDNYFEAIELNVSISKIKLKNVCVYNVVPPIKKSNTWENPEYPYVGTDEERKQYVLYFNSKIKEKCIEKEYIFFDIYDNYSDADGFLRKDLSDDNVHIRNGVYINNFIKENKL